MWQNGKPNLEGWRNRVSLLEARGVITNHPSARWLLEAISPDGKAGVFSSTKSCAKWILKNQGGTSDEEDSDSFIGGWLAGFSSVGRNGGRKDLG